jgi:hypothetical protein
MALAKRACDKERSYGRGDDSCRRRRLISPGLVTIPDKSLGFSKGFLARDPDGHGLQLIEK